MKKLLMVSAVAALGLTSAAFAGGLLEETPASSTGTSSDIGVYFGIEGGVGTVHWSDVFNGKTITGGGRTVTMPSISGSKYGITGRAFLGADLNRYFALELGYTYFAKKMTLETNGVKGDFLKNTQSFDLMGKIKAPVVDSFDIYAKLGANYLMSTLDGDGEKRKNFNVAFGAGADYYITPNIIANIEWLRFNGNGKLADDYQPNADAFMIGLRYRIDI